VPPTTAPAAPELAPGVEAALAGVVQVVTGRAHSCARLSNGTAKCWGENGDGQLGDATNTDRVLSVTVRAVTGAGPLTGIANLTSNGDVTCARLTTEQARCWGEGFLGALGDGTANAHKRPIVVKKANGKPLTTIKQLSTSGAHTCARVIYGQVRCWGDNGNGQLGDGTKTDRFFPAVTRGPGGIGPLTAMAEVEAGHGFTCGRVNNGDERCWGGEGLNGNGTFTDQVLPVTVLDPSGTIALRGIAQVTAGRSHACARLFSGQARCWGGRGDGGVLGDANTSPAVALLPVVVKNETNTGNLTGITQLSGGGTHMCALLASSQARCWGENDHGQLGNNVVTALPNTVPRIVRNDTNTANLTGVLQISAGLQHTCARFPIGARCWGYNLDGQLGIGAKVPVDNPLPLVVQK
jgi:alpha-tubulin suppressor-like RCC1 family protein